MSKYVIEFEDNPWYQDDYVGYYKCGEIPWWSAKKSDIKKLTPLDKELEEAYQKGKHDAEQDLARAAYEEAYQKGYEVGSHEATTLEYQQGLDDAWEAARKICNEPEDGGLPASAVVELFGRNGSILGCSAQNAINKIKAYEEQQKADEIKVGDEVMAYSGDAIVFSKFWKGEEERCTYWYPLSERFDSCKVRTLRKTGRHFPQVAELLKAMKEGAE